MSLVLAEDQLSIGCRRASLAYRKQKDFINVSSWRNKHFWRLVLRAFCIASVCQKFLSSWLGVQKNIRAEINLLQKSQIFHMVHFLES